MMEGGCGGFEAAKPDIKSINYVSAQTEKSEAEKNRYEKWNNDCELVAQKCLIYCPKIEIEDFKDVYSSEVVEKDKSWTEYLKNGFKSKDENMAEIVRDSHIRSDAMEALIVFQERDNWFGENAYLTRTSEYDDYNNHVDVVVEFAIPDKETQRMALAVDATSAHSNFDKIVDKKIERNIENIRYDKSKVKYFESQVEDKNGKYFKGKLQHLLPVVVGLDEKDSDRLIELSADIFKLEEKGSIGNDDLRVLKKRIEKHPAQLIFLEEMKIQLEMYREMEIYGNNKKIEDILEIINGVMEEKKDMTADIRYINMKKNDRTYNQIVSKCKSRLEEARNEVK